MSKRGRPAKPGERYPSGALKPQRDLGAIQLRGRRAALVGGDGKADDRRAGYPLGILNLRRLLTDADHATGLRYARFHHLVFGCGSPPSLLGTVVAGVARAVTAPDEPHRIRRLIAAEDDPERLKRLRWARGGAPSGKRCSPRARHPPALRCPAEYRGVRAGDALHGYEPSAVPCSLDGRPARPRGLAAGNRRADPALGPPGLRGKARGRLKIQISA